MLADAGISQDLGNAFALPDRTLNDQAEHERIQVALSAGGITQGKSRLTFCGEREPYPLHALCGERKLTTAAEAAVAKLPLVD